MLVQTSRCLCVNSAASFKFFSLSSALATPTPARSAWDFVKQSLNKVIWQKATSVGSFCRYRVCSIIFTGWQHASRSYSFRCIWDSHFGRRGGRRGQRWPTIRKSDGGFDMLSIVAEACDRRTDKQISKNLHLCC